MLSRAAALSSNSSSPRWRNRRKSCGSFRASSYTHTVTWKRPAISVSNWTLAKKRYVVSLSEHLPAFSFPKLVISLLVAQASRCHGALGKLMCVYVSHIKKSEKAPLCCSFFLSYCTIVELKVDSYTAIVIVPITKRINDRW